MSRIRVADGWVCVPYTGPDLATVHLAVAAGPEPADGEWRPAFLDWLDGERVAKIRTTPDLPRRLRVWRRVNGHAERVR